MKIGVKLEPSFLEPEIVIYTPKITQQVISWVEMLENSETKSTSLMLKKDDKIFIIEPKQIEIARTEEGGMKLYTREKHEYTLAKPLNKILKRLGIGFARISKSCIVNINRIDHISQSFSTSMKIVMKNGVTDYISRKYWSDFKKLF